MEQLFVAAAGGAMPSHDHKILAAQDMAVTAEALPNEPFDAITLDSKLDVLF